MIFAENDPRRHPGAEARQGLDGVAIQMTWSSGIRGVWALRWPH